MTRSVWRWNDVRGGQSVSGVPRRRWGYEVLRLGTNGLPVSTRAMASSAPKPFLRAVEVRLRQKALAPSDKRILRGRTFREYDFRSNQAMPVTEHRLVRVQEKGQVTLPAELRRRLGLKRGDLMAITETEDGVLITPQEVVAMKALDRIGAGVDPLSKRAGSGE